jgi:hypothetical protein
MSSEKPSEPLEPVVPSEEAGANSEPDAAAAEPPAAPSLNRAARRAQARGKKGASGASPAGGLPSDRRFGGGSHPTFLAGKARIPRTGHK